MSLLSSLNPLSWLSKGFDYVYKHVIVPAFKRIDDWISWAVHKIFKAAHDILFIWKLMVGFVEYLPRGFFAAYHLFVHLLYTAGNFIGSSVSFITGEIKGFVVGLVKDIRNSVIWVEHWVEHVFNVLWDRVVKWVAQGLVKLFDVVKHFIGRIVHDIMHDIKVVSDVADKVYNDAEQFIAKFPTTFEVLFEKVLPKYLFKLLNDISMFDLLGGWVVKIIEWILFDS